MGEGACKTNQLLEVSTMFVVTYISKYIAGKGSLYHWTGLLD